MRCIPQRYVCTYAIKAQCPAGLKKVQNTHCVSVHIPISVLVPLSLEEAGLLPKRAYVAQRYKHTDSILLTHCVFPAQLFRNTNTAVCLSLFIYMHTYMYAQLD